MGLVQGCRPTPAMLAGTHYEHRILDVLNIQQRDRQIKMPALLLRVNLDGETWETIKEIKTHKHPIFKVTRGYWQQCQVQMFAAAKWCEIVAYKFTDEEYRNYFLPIDPQRLSFHPIAYDPGWVEREYLPRLEYLAFCLRRRLTPDAFRFRQSKG